MEPADLPGRTLVRASWISTALVAVVSVAGTISPSTFETTAALVSLVLFAAGTVTFLAALLAGARRSRTHELGIGGWFFLLGSAPRRMQAHLMGSFALQCVIALAAASLRPFTRVAFVILAPMFPLAVAGLWGAMHGTFGPRVIDAPQRLPAEPGARSAPQPSKRSPRPSDGGDRPTPRRGRSDKSGPSETRVGQNDPHG